MKYISSRSIQVTSTDNKKLFLLQAGVPTEVPLWAEGTALFKKFTKPYVDLQTKKECPPAITAVATGKEHLVAKWDWPRVNFSPEKAHSTIVATGAAPADNPLLRGRP